MKRLEGFREMLDRLGQVRNSMEGAKNTKLRARALRVLGPSDIRDEVIDVANCLEFLWDVLELAKA